MFQRRDRINLPLNLLIQSGTKISSLVVENRKINEVSLNTPYSHKNVSINFNYLLHNFYVLQGYIFYWMETKTYISENYYFCREALIVFKAQLYRIVSYFDIQWCARISGHD